jgi:hypothetical protein
MIPQNARNILFLKKLSYNKTYLSDRLLTYLLVRLRINRETQSKRLKNRIFREESDPFWRPISPPKIFSKDQSTLPSESSSVFLPTEQSLLYRRRSPGAFVSHHSRAGADRNVPSPQAQWRLPISDGIAGLSQSDHAATIPSAYGPDGAEPIEKTPQSVVVDDDPEARPSAENHFRSRLDGSAAVRKTGIGGYRVQSGQERPAVVSSFALFQRPNEGLLAGGAASRRHAHRHGRGRTSPGGFCQDSRLRQGQNCQGRQGILRPQDGRISGIEEGAFCDRRPLDQARQKEAFGPHLQDLHLRHRNLGVYLPADEMEEGVSFHRDPSADSRGAVGPADAFFFGEIQLSGDRHGSPDQSAQRLEVLQRSGRDRVDHQRAEGGLPVGQNPDEVFCGQRGVFSSTVVRLQSGQLVQTALFAEGVSETDAEKLAGTDSSGAQRTDPDGKQTDPEVPSELLA